MERGEQQPEIRLPWLEDEEGYYLVIKTDSGRVEIRPSNTDLYTHNSPYEAVDHIFYEHYTNENEVSMGFRLWRKKFDSILGEGAFDVLSGDMRRRDFFEVNADKPTDEDMKYWEGDFGKFVIPEKDIIEIGNLLLKNYDSEFNYFLGDQGEWRI